MTPVISYYDIRNTLFVNEKFVGLSQNRILIQNMISKWKKHRKLAEYEWSNIISLAIYDYYRGMMWIYKIDSENYNRRLEEKKYKVILPRICLLFIALRSIIHRHKER